MSWEDVLGALATIVAALIAAIVALRTAGHRQRRAVKEEAEILAAMPPDVPSADILRQTLDRHMRRYVLNQTSVGRQLFFLGAWGLGIWILAAGAALYLGSEYAPGWADELGELWDPLDGSGLWPAVLAYGLLFIGLGLWSIEARSVYRLGPAGREAVRDHWREFREFWRRPG